jgi:aldehyde dehydrogenase (NAD+)
VCCAGSRLLVEEPVFEPLLAKLKDRLQTLRVGDPLDKNTDVGAINSRAQLTKIEELVESGVEEGARSTSPSASCPERGFWFRPTLFTGVSQSPPHRARGDLRAGAVDPHVPHGRGGRREGEQHAVRLSAGVWTDKARGSCGWRSGCAPASCGRTRSTGSTASPFGGYKESGFGREGGSHGRAYLELEADRRMSPTEHCPSSAPPSCSCGWQIPAQRVSAVVTGLRTTDVRWDTRRRPRERISATPWSRRAPRSRDGPA